MDDSEWSLAPSDEQMRYARILGFGMTVGFTCLLITLFVYLTGWSAPHVPLDRLMKLWGHEAGGVAHYLKAADVKPGWNWVFLAGHGDFMNLIGIAILSGLTILCQGALIPMFLKKGDKIYAVMALLEVIILVAAASGIFSGGR